MKELKVRVGRNEEDKVTFIEPVNKAKGKTVETDTMVARLLSQDDVDKEIKELMEERHVYKRRGRRIRQMR